MADKMQVEIITPSRTVVSDQFEMLVVRALDGEIGILADHIPLISSLAEWPVKLKKSDGTVRFVCVSGGFMEVCNNVVTILATSAELPEEIDAQRVEAAKERAEDRLAKENVDRIRAEAALRRAVGRLKTLELYTHKTH